MVRKRRKNPNGIVIDIDIDRNGRQQNWWHWISLTISFGRRTPITRSVEIKQKKTKMMSEIHKFTKESDFDHFQTQIESYL